MGTKGARLTTFVALPSRLMVYMPRGEGIGVSARIEDEAERARLKALVAEAVPQQTIGGYIVRTAAQGASMEQIRDDIQYLGRLWQHVKEKGLRAQSGELVYEDLPLPTRILRDELARGVDRVLVDNATSHARMLEFAAGFMPGSTTSIDLYTGQRPIFDLHGVEEEIGKALERSVNLKSGGHLVIDQTESMTTIDVNTGGFVGHRNLEDTIFRTNLEAAVAIARQLQTAQPGRHHHHRFHRHGGRRAPHPGAGSAAARAGGRSRADPHRQRLLARPGGNDPQENPRQPGTFALCGVSQL